MGEDPVLVVRDSEGKVHAFLNICRHRGNRLCRADAGNAERFTCAYHGWTYRNDGRLVGVPYFREAYYGALERERWGLIPVAQLDSYKGLLFATFDPTAPPLQGRSARWARIRARSHANGMTTTGARLLSVAVMSRLSPITRSNK